MIRAVDADQSDARLLLTELERIDAKQRRAAFLKSLSVGAAVVVPIGAALFAFLVIPPVQQGSAAMTVLIVGMAFLPLCLISALVFGILQGFVSRRLNRHLRLIEEKDLERVSIESGDRIGNYRVEEHDGVVTGLRSFARYTRLIRAVKLTLAFAATLGFGWMLWFQIQNKGSGWAIGKAVIIFAIYAAVLYVLLIRRVIVAWVLDPHQRVFAMMSVHPIKGTAAMEVPLDEITGCVEHQGKFYGVLNSSDLFPLPVPPIDDPGEYGIGSDTASFLSTIRAIRIANMLGVQPQSDALEPDQDPSRSADEFQPD